MGGCVYFAGGDGDAALRALMGDASDDL